MPRPSSRDTAFAALVLLRCRSRIESILGALAEHRRIELAPVLSEFDGFDEARLKQILAEAVRREDAALSDAAARDLGAGMAKASRAIRKLAARGKWR